MRRYLLVVLLVGTMVSQPLQLSAQDQPEEFPRDVLEGFAEVMDVWIAGSAAFWASWLGGRGLQIQPPKIYYIYPGERRRTECAVQTRAGATEWEVGGSWQNAFYCSLDIVEEGGTVYRGAIYVPMLPLVTMLATGDVWGHGRAGVGQFGNLTAMAILSHEYGHHVMFEMKRLLGDDVAFPDAPDFELFADCSAGYFVGVLFGYVELGESELNLGEDDIDTIVEGMSLLGDPPGFTSHGTPEQRSEAFRIGYEGGYNSPNLCFSNFWSLPFPGLGG